MCTLMTPLWGMSTHVLCCLCPVHRWTGLRFQPQIFCQLGAIRSQGLRYKPYRYRDLFCSTLDMSARGDLYRKVFLLWSKCSHVFPIYLPFLFFLFFIMHLDFYRFFYSIVFLTIKIIEEKVLRHILCVTRYQVIKIIPTRYSTFYSLWWFKALCKVHAEAQFGEHSDAQQLQQLYFIFKGSLSQGAASR